MRHSGNVQPRPINPSPSSRESDEPSVPRPSSLYGFIDRNRKFADSPLEERVSCELVSEIGFPAPRKFGQNAQFGGYAIDRDPRGVGGHIKVWDQPHAPWVCPRNCRGLFRRTIQLFGRVKGVSRTSAASSRLEGLLNRRHVTRFRAMDQKAFDRKSIPQNNRLM